MRNLTILLLFITGTLFGQSSSVTATKIRAEESFRVGSSSSQAVSGFNTTITGSPTDTKLPTSKAVVDWVTGNVILSGATAGGDLSGTYPNPTVDALQGFAVSGTTPIMGQVLQWSGSQYVPTTPSGTTYTAGTGIAISGGNVISNTGIIVEVDGSVSNEIQTLSFSDPNLSISGGNSVDLSALTPTTEQQQDLVGAMVSSNTETLIAVTYDDSGGKLNFAVTPTLSSYTNDAGFLTAEVDGNIGNEYNTAFTVTGGNLRLTDGGGNLDVPVSSIAPVQAVSAGTGISISGTTTRTITSTITQADGSETIVNAGTGISKSGSGTSGSPYVITNTGDLSSTNELNTSFGINGSNLRLIDPGGTIDVALTAIAPVQGLSAGTGISVSAAPNITVTNTGDLSNTNELQTLSVAANAVTLSNSGGTFTLAGAGNSSIGTAGSTITVTTPVSTTSVVTANGFAGTVANATSNPAITVSTTVTGVLKGNGTAISAASTADGLVPSGGTTAQILSKIDGTDFNYEWVDPSGGGGSATLPYLVYSALLTQSGTDAPTVEILENTIGDIVWTRTGTGAYVGTLAGAFTEIETWQVCDPAIDLNNGGYVKIQRADADNMTVVSYDGLVGADGILNNAPIEIRVYSGSSSLTPVDALGTGFTGGGGSGTIPDATTASLESEGKFSFNYNSGVVGIHISEKPDDVLPKGIVLQNQSEEVTMQLTDNGFVFRDDLNVKGAVYYADYSANQITDDNAVPSVKAVNLLIGNTIKSGTVSTTGTATTTFTVTIGSTMPNNTYKVNVTGGNALSATAAFVNNKSTTTFDVVYLTGLTGAVLFDWVLVQ